MLPQRDKIRVICHDLKMRTLVGIDDPTVLSDIRARIHHLPSAESIAVMEDKQVAAWRKTLDKLLFDIDRADRRRTYNHSIKHRIDKGIPPYRPAILAAAQPPPKSSMGFGSKKAHTWYQRLKTASAYELSRDEIRVIQDLDRWYDATHGGETYMSLGWTAYEANIANELVEAGYLAYVHPPERNKGFFVLTPHGEAVIEQTCRPERRQVAVAQKKT